MPRKYTPTSKRQAEKRQTITKAQKRREKAKLAALARGEPPPLRRRRLTQESFPAEASSFPAESQEESSFPAESQEESIGVQISDDVLFQHINYQMLYGTPNWEGSQLMSPGSPDCEGSHLMSPGSPDWESRLGEPASPTSCGLIPPTAWELSSQELNLQELSSQEI